VKPNRLKVALLHVPICQSDRINCVDLLDALTRRVLGTEESVDMGKFQADGAKKTETRKNYVIISNTMKRYQELSALRVIIRTFKRWMEWKTNPENAALLMTRRNQGKTQPAVENEQEISTELSTGTAVPKRPTELAIIEHTSTPDRPDSPSANLKTTLSFEVLNEENESKNSDILL